ncbi:MAG TPA: type II secretion system protein [Methylocella sp.]|nr:type II secretion system protein [Methylocella sp.]
MHLHAVNLALARVRGGREKGVTVENLQADSLQSGSRRQDQNGFSLIEMILVVAIIFIVSAMAIIALQPTWQQYKANAATQQVKEALRQAREYAISQRRTVAVSFSNDAFGNPQVVLNLYTVANQVESLDNTPFLTLPIESTVKFTTFGNLPDTPDAFGDSSALDFNNTAYATGTILKFQSDGTFTDVVGTPINGSIFIGIPGMPNTARAITILGSTGRIKSWSGANQAGWFQQ